MNNDENFNKIIHELNNFQNIINSLQNNFFSDLDSLVKLNNKINILISKLEDNIDIKKEVSLLEETIKFFNIELLGLNPAFVNVYDNYNDPGILAKDRKNQNLIVEVSSNNIDISNIGDYEIVYTIKNSNNYIFGTYVRIINVVDIISPIITLVGDNPLTVEVNTQMPANVDASNNFGASATDNYDTVVDVSYTTDLNINVIGSYQIIYTASDSNGNDASAVRIINVVDIISPIITLVGDNPLTIEVNTQMPENININNDFGASASDNYDNIVDISYSTDLNINVIGTYQIIYTASDSNGNNASIVRIINVVDTTPPEINLIGANPLTIEVNTQMPENINVNNFYGAIASDNYDNIVDVSFNTDLNINIVGSYVINYYATDSNGNDASAVRVVNIIDSTPPEVDLIGENPIIVNKNIPYIDLGLSALDNYDPSLTVIEETNIDVNKVGIYNYTYNVLDDFSNSTLITRVIYVLDYSLLNNIPIINITDDNSNNVANILKMVDNTNYFENNDLALSDNFVIKLKNTNINYEIPLDKLKNIYSNNNNMIILVYGYNNEVISIINNDNNIDTKFPYITSEFILKKVVNLILNNNNNYKLIVIDGFNKNILQYFEPTIELIGPNPYDLSINNIFIEPGYTAQDYNGNDISNLVTTQTNLDITNVGNYEILYIATDLSGYQSVESRTINVINDAIEIN